MQRLRREREIANWRRKSSSGWLECIGCEREVTGPLGVWRLAKVFGLPSEGDAELLHLIAAGNRKCHPAALGSWVGDEGALMQGDQ